LRLMFTMRAVVCAVVVAGSLATAAAADAARYMVVFRGHDVPRDAVRQIERAGGTLAFSYDRIGVVLADSDDPTFLDRLDGRQRVSSAAEIMAGSGVESYGDDGDEDDDGDGRGRLPNEPATDADTFSPLQWSLGRINAQAAHALSGGSPAVLVANLDTGVDPSQPDLTDNLSVADSASCLGGIPSQAVDPVTGRPAFFDTNGHGTHTSGIIAAADNGIGIVGVAPNVRLAAVKVVDPAGKIYPEAVVCGYMWAAAHGASVVNTSFGIDKRVLDPARPERDRFYCLDDPAERTIATAVGRAAKYARRNGVTLVASAGNNNIDLANPAAGNQCLRLPVELPGVVGVSSTTREGQLTFHSNYGLGVIDVTAPGGDIAEQAPPAGLVLSTLPGFVPPSATRPGDGGGTFGYAFGTSQAAPHVSGVAALVASAYGKFRRGDASMSPKKVERILERTAEPMPCPPNPYVRVAMGQTFTSTCAEEKGLTGFFGHGEVDALAAIAGARHLGSRDH
jgi:lantibiotic leader peptide-processing serine protease